MALRKNAVLPMDQPGWHNSAKLEVPDHITIVLTVPLAGAQPRRRILAVHARQPAVEPGLQVLR